MLSEWIERAVGALADIGFHVERGYPATKIPVIHSPVVMISMEEYGEKFVTLALDVFVPAEHGGSECEETAVRVANVLAETMAACSVGACKYAGKMGMFQVHVVAKWFRELDYAVKVNDTQIPHVISCHTVRSKVRLPYVNGETGETVVTVDGAEWKITIEDIWPLNHKIEAEQSGSFTLLLVRPGGLEAYPECVWTEIRLEETPAGVLRTRVAVTSRDRVIGAG